MNPPALIDLAAPGYAVRHRGRTHRLRPPSPAARARLDALLRARRLAGTRGRPDQERRAALAAVRAGEADHGSEWAAAVLAGEEGTLLLLAALLDATPEEAAEMLADPQAGPELVEALTLCLPAPQAGPAADGPPDWPGILGALAKALPGRTPAELAELTDAQVAAVLRWAADVAGVRTVEGEWSAEEALGPEEEPAP